MTTGIRHRARGGWYSALVCFTLIAGGVLLMAAQPGNPTALVYIGTYTGPKSEGIYAFRFDTTRGTLEPLGLAAKTSNPSFLALHPSKPLLYAVNEDSTFAGTKSGSVTGFERASGSHLLHPLNQQPSGGGGPCHLTIDPSAAHLLLANYGGGSIADLAVADDGRLGAPRVVQHSGSSADPKRQKGPHAHMVQIDPSHRFLLAVDLGLDRVLVYHFDAKSGLGAKAGEGVLEPGSGPRHIAFGHDGKHVYCINELSSTITVFEWNGSTGALTPVQTVPTVQGSAASANSTAEIAVHPSGGFLIGSNRGADTLALFTIDPATGRLKPAGSVPTGGKTPRSFAFSRRGDWVIAANQDSDSLTVFKVDAAGPALTRVGAPVSVGSPVCVLFAE